MAISGLLRNMKYYVYILKSKSSDKHYVGQTNNLERRLREHNSGKSTYTKKFIPWEIVYYEEKDNQAEAIKTEKFYKSASGRKKIKKILSPVAQ